MASFGIFLAHDASGSGRSEAPAGFRSVVQFFLIDGHRFLHDGNHGLSRSIISIAASSLLLNIIAIWPLGEQS